MSAVWQQLGSADRRAGASPRLWRQRQLPDAKVCGVATAASIGSGSGRCGWGGPTAADPAAATFALCLVMYPDGVTAGRVIRSGDV